MHCGCSGRTSQILIQAGFTCDWRKDSRRCLSATGHQVARPKSTTAAACSPLPCTELMYELATTLLPPGGDHAGHAPDCRPKGALVKFAPFVLLALLLAVPAAVQGQLRDSYEAPETSWKLSDHDCTLRILQHQRTFEQMHSGRTSEQLQFFAGSGTYVHMVSPLPAYSIIDELTISIWVKSDRPGLQLAMRVVLPRSQDPRTGSALTTLIRGSSYQEADTWQKLTIQAPARLLTREVPLLRSQFGSDVDDREAYADMLVLNVYGGTGQTNVWLDDLEVVGQVESPLSGADSANAASPNAIHSASELGTTRNQDVPVLEGSVFVIDGHPQLVRAIDGNGEPFAWLKSLGFNAVSLAAPPTAEQLREAGESGIWLIVPPPASQSPDEYGSSLAHILAWDLGRHLAADQVEPTRRLAQRLRSVADHLRRPTLCLPAAERWQYSRLTDLTVLEPPGPNSSLQLGDYGQWYLERSRLMRMGTFFWASIRTQLSPRVTQQLRALGADAAVPLSLEPDQIRLLVYHAVASGARGLVFRSESRLDDSDRQTTMRAKTLQRINQELAVLEPWAATGEQDGELDTGDPSVRVSVLKIDRSRLLLIIRRMADQQYVAVPSDERSITVEVPGVPETDEVYQVGEDGLRRIPQQRGTGLRVRLDKPRSVTSIVMTQDQQVINFLARQTAALRKEQDQLVGEIAAHLYSAVVETQQQLLELTPAAGIARPHLESDSLSQARTELQQFQQLVEGGGHDRAYEFLQRGLQQLATARYQSWKLAANSFSSPVASPLCTSFFSLPQHYVLGQRLRNTPWGPNSLAGGDFENLSVLQSSGWKNVSGTSPQLRTGVELSLHAPHSGRTSLRLQCWPTDPQQAPSVIETAPVTITSAPIPVTTGQIVRIHGFARVPTPVRGSLDGLRIFDSLAGEDLAERLVQTKDWHEFTLYRAAPRDGVVTVTFALSGIGEAWIDDVTLHLLGTSTSQAQLPAAAAPVGAPRDAWR